MMLRKSVADAPRRAQVCAAVNDRYLDALAIAKVATPAGQLAGAGQWEPANGAEPANGVRF